MRNLIYDAGRSLFAVYFGACVRLTVENEEYFPQDGPAILCANHISWFDPPLMAVLAPGRIHFMAKKELFANPVFDRVMRAVNAFPVDRTALDRTALKRGLDVLSGEGILCLFPEGTRQPRGKVGDMSLGASYLALKSGAPLVPVGVSGDFRPGGKLRVRVGRPIEIPEVVGVAGQGSGEKSGLSRKVWMRRLTDKLRQTIEVLAYGE